MSNKPEDLNSLKLIIERQNSEVTAHWSRNSCFLVVMSILTLAYGQNEGPIENLFQLTVFRILISLLGAALSIVWLLIQYRSSEYIKYYKTEARRLAESSKTTNVYPVKIGGIEMRKLAFVLPAVFLLIWLAFLVMALVTLNSPVT